MKQFLLLFLFFPILNSFAQSPLQKIIIKGFVIDSATNQPLGYATVILTDLKTAKPVTSLLTKEDGSFEVTVARYKQYAISFVYVGYITRIINIQPDEKSWIADLGKIKLAASAGQLKEVAITAVKPLLKKEIDRISYDVQANPESKVMTHLKCCEKYQW